MKILVHTVIPNVVHYISMNIEDKLKNKNKIYKTIDIRGVIENIYCLADVVDYCFNDEGISDIFSISSLATLKKDTLEYMIKCKSGNDEEWDQKCEKTISRIQKSCNDVIAMRFEDLIKYGSSGKYIALSEIKDKNDLKYSYKEILDLYNRKPWLQIETVEKRCNKYIEFLNRLIKDIDKNKDSINTDTRRMPDDDESEQCIDKYRNSIIEIKKQYNRLFANYTVALTHYASLCSRVNREYAANIKIMCDYFNKYLTIKDQNDDPYETDYNSDEEWEDELNDE